MWQIESAANPQKTSVVAVWRFESLDFGLVDGRWLQVIRNGRPEIGQICANWVMRLGY
jgi:hypothetical protein